MKIINCLRWFVVTLFTSFFSLSAWAEGVNDDVATNGGVMCIEFVSGEKRTFELSDKPQLLFSIDGVTVKSEKLEADLLAYSGIKKISFQPGTSTSVDEKTTMQEKTVSVRFTDSNIFEVYGIDGRQSSVTVYALDGKTMLLDADRSDNAVVVHLNGYKSGTYIIKVGNQTYKVIKK